MRPPPAKIGQRLTDVLTPALMISMPVLEKNEAAMRAALRGSGVALRPHFKAQKSSACAKWLQKQAGSELAGLCAQTLTEAEVLLRSGATPSWLLTNEVIGPAATARAAALAVDYPGGLSVLADCEAGGAGLSAAAVAAGAAELAVLVEVDCGQDRCGVASSRAGAVAALAQAIVDAPGLRFGGLHVYHGAIQHVRTIADRKAEVEKGPKAVAARCLAELKAAGIDSVPVVTGGGTGTFELAVASGPHAAVGSAAVATTKSLSPAAGGRRHSARKAAVAGPSTTESTSSSTSTLFACSAWASKAAARPVEGEAPSLNKS